MKFSDLPLIGKVIGGVVIFMATAVVGVFGWMTLTFETLSASDTKWQAHIQANQCSKVSDYRIKIERLKWDLDNLELTEAQRSAKQRDLQLYLNEITRLDPTRMC